MLEALAAFCKKHRQILLYLFFGGVTTVVSYAVYFVLYNRFNCYASVSNAVSWVIAVVVAYLTNKPFVFQSRDWSAHTVLVELSEFAGLRLLSGVLETAVIFLFCDLLCWNGNWVKVVTSIFVIILNFLFSKFVVFRKKQ